MWSKGRRFQEFLARMWAAEAASSADEAYQLLASTLNAVEDEYTNVPYDPSRWMADGRMYPPQPDSARPVDGRADVVRYRSRAHNTYIGSDGTIIIEEKDGRCILKKNGAGPPTQ